MEDPANGSRFFGQIIGAMQDAVLYIGGGQDLMGDIQGNDGTLGCKYRIAED